MRIQYVTNGSQREVSDAIGHALVQRKIATYATREMRPETAPVSEIDRLRAECDQRGIKYHHRAGVARLRELLKG